jgi:hypothetical protein
MDPDSLRRGAGPVTCHYCGEEIGADEALLIRDGERCTRTARLRTHGARPRPQGWGSVE